MSELCASVIFHISGVVQGVGFRPFVSRIAQKYNICGRVINKGAFVEVIAQGDEPALEKFAAALKNEAPLRSDIVSIERKSAQLPPMTEFVIAESQGDKGEIFIPPDIATCPNCRQELFDKSDRRYLHSFINCTDCGPRLTILEELPYDRERTSMKKFPMCPECEREYYNIATRRYDAQPVCCNHCGPEVYLMGTELVNGDAITQTRKLLMQGSVVAIKGIGGFHLACDGRNAAAVSRLRELKHRPRKPFAVMMRDLETVKRECIVTPEAEKWLDGCEKPILLLDKHLDSALPDELAPGNPTLGVMLPYAPLQMLLFDYPDEVAMTDVLVMTSGNVSGAPICRSEEDAVREIGIFCDAILSHNRDIRLRADDSVMSLYDDKPYMIRRSRGFAPLPFRLPLPGKKSVLAMGGELKNAFCIVKNDLAYMAPHLGDMGDLRTTEALQESIKVFTGMLESNIEQVVCDLHPGYITTQIAESMQKPLLKIQHHWAHILACMAENRCADPVIGVAMDGTGYGTDGTVWGGEILLARTDNFERFAHIDDFPQAGGDASSREGWRIAAGIMNKLNIPDSKEIVQKLNICSAQEYNVISAMIKNRINTVQSTSAGRLFDAVSALLGIACSSTFEGDAAMALEFAAEKFVRSNPQSLSAPGKVENWLLRDTDKLFEHLFCERLAGADSGWLAYVFHRSLAVMIANSCEEARNFSRLNRCALSGGTFQNHLLLDLCVKELKKRDFDILLHSLVPPNDGGIALGQALAATVLSN